jgi:hypothetical protein
MLTATHKGNGTLNTPDGRQDVSYVLTVTRTPTADDGYGHVQSKHVDFANLLLAGQPITLQVETGSLLKIVLSTAAGERAVFNTSDSIPGSLSRSLSRTGQ